MADRKRKPPEKATETLSELLSKIRSNQASPLSTKSLEATIERARPALAWFLQRATGTHPWQPIAEADAWLRLACPQLYEHGPGLEKAGLVARMEKGFDWKLRPVYLAALLGYFGFQDWKKLERYFTVNGKALRSSSVERQLQRLRNEGGGQRDWHRIQAVIPEARLPKISSLE